MGTITRHTNAPFQDGEILLGAELEQDFATIYDEFNGNIDDANLADGAVTTDKLGANAVTQAKMTSGAASTSSAALSNTGAIGVSFADTYTNVGSALSVTIGNPARHVAIFLSCLLTSDEAAIFSTYIQLYKDGSPLYAASFVDRFDNPVETGTTFKVINKMWVDTAPTPGATHSYQVKMKSDDPANANSVFNINLFAIEPRS